MKIPFVILAATTTLWSVSARAQDTLAQPASDVPLSVPRQDTQAMPQSAAAALKQAESAYEYGDMPLLVESARLVTDGTLKSTESQRAEGFRFLGIGLYVTGRVQGAKTAFEQLLTLRPDTRLDAGTTRPEIITFFLNLRQARIEQLREAQAVNRPSVMWNFLPPMGQFNNGQRVKGWVLLAAEASTWIVATTAFAIVKGWEQRGGSVCELGWADERCEERTETAQTLRVVQLGSSFAFAALYLYGVLDGLSERNKPRSEADLLRSAPPVSVSLLPNGAALHVRF